MVDEFKAFYRDARLKSLASAGHDAQQDLCTHHQWDVSCSQAQVPSVSFAKDSPESLYGLYGSNHVSVEYFTTPLAGVKYSIPTLQIRTGGTERLIELLPNYRRYMADMGLEPRFTESQPEPPEQRLCSDDATLSTRNCIETSISFPHSPHKSGQLLLTGIQ